MKKTLTILFDLDGTITDSGPGIMGCFRKTIDAHGIEWTAPLETFIGPTADVWTKILLPNHSEEAKARFVRDYRSCYDREGWKNSKVYPGVVEMLEGLGRRGARLFVCTSKLQKPAERILGHFGLTRYFERIYADNPEFTSHSKRDLIARLIREERVESATAWMVGDRHFDIAAGQANGLRTIAATYGYGSLAELTEARPDALCSSPGEILTFLSATDGSNRHATVV